MAEKLPQIQYEVHDVTYVYTPVGSSVSRQFLDRFDTFEQAVDYCHHAALRHELKDHAEITVVGWDD